MNKLREKGGGTPTRRAVLNLLKTQGPSDPQALATRLRLSPMAVRQHLYALRRLKLVAFKLEGRPSGRPAKVWHLLRAADRYYPDAHPALAIDLIEAARSAFGQKQFGRLLAKFEERERRAVAQRVPPKAPLRQRIASLVRQRTEQGYLADLKEPENGVFFVIENHCPILTAASACRGLCDAELGVFQSVLGKDCRVERTEHALDRNRRCVFRVVAAR